MALVELDEMEVARLRQIEQVAGKMMRDPKAKKLLEMAHKQVDPNAITPALDQERQIQEPVNAALERVKDLEAKLQTERDEREKAEKLSVLNKTINDGFAELRKQGWQEDGIKAVDALMQEKGILDPTIAAAYIEKTMPPQQPATPSGSGMWNFVGGIQDGEADLKKLIDSKGEYEPLIDKMAHDALNEFRGRR